MTSPTLPLLPHPGPARPRHPRLVAVILLQLGLLVSQYVAGMYLNLFATIPPMFGSGGMMGGGMMAFMSSSSMPALMFHMMVALLILVLGVFVVIGALLSRERSLLAVSSFALAGIVAAIVSGMAYLFYRADADSLGMASSYLLAFGMTAWCLAIAWKGTTGGRIPLPTLPEAT